MAPRQGSDAPPTGGAFRFLPAGTDRLPRGVRGSELPCMITPTLLALVSLAAPVCDGVPPASAPLPAATADSLEPLWSRGRSFAEFLGAARARRETWTGNYAAAAPDPALVARGRQVAGAWRLLVVAEDWCGDSAHTIPYLARLVDSLPGVSLRIVSSADGRWLMNRHRTPDGRAATPTVVLLDAAGLDRGCFVERPQALQDYARVERPKTAEADWLEKKYAWYRRDAGASTMTEIVEILEAAAAGAPRCAGAEG